MEENMKKVLIFIGLIPLFQVSMSCPDGWVKHGQMCYHFSHDQEIFIAAKAICQDWGGELVEIESREESNFLADHAKLTNVAYYIGLTDLVEEGVWRWYTSNSLPTYTVWAPGEPDNYQGNENCAQLRADRVWGDVPCGTSRHYICEMAEE